MKKESVASTGVYRIDRKLGEGGSGTVFLAHKEDSGGFLRHPVAVKVFRSSELSPVFNGEIQALMRVHSSFCVRVFGWESWNGSPAIVMEAVDGVSLKTLARVDLLPEETDELVRQIALGLRDLHQAGVVHGDLSASNVLVDVEGRVRLIDFGLEPAGNTEVRGTPRYLSPSRWSGKSPEPGDDWFALTLLESDLKGGEMQSEGPLWFWRERAERMGAGKEAAEFLKLEMDMSVRRGLGERVRQLAAMTSGRTEGFSRRLFLPKTKFNWRKIRNVAALLFLSFGVSTGSEGQWRRGRLSVQTHRWVRVFIDGADFGYNPIYARSIPAGKHRVTWRSQATQGVLTISVAENQDLVLSDADFR